VSVPITLVVDTLTGYLSLSFPVLNARLFTIVIFTPLVEEFSKAYPLFYRHGETERSLCTLGLFVGLGFGTSEFFIYVILLSVPIIIRLPGILFHLASTTITTYGIAKRNPARFYLISVLLHALSNFSSLYSSYGLIDIIVIVVIAVSFSAYLYSQTSEEFLDSKVGEGKATSA
jgi:hypothetical protein